MDVAAARELTHLSVAEAGRMLLAHDISPVDLVEAFLDHIAAIDGAIKSYLLVDVEGARGKAKRRAEADIMAGRWRGMLYGIPFGAKDNYYTKGLRTTANSRVLIDHLPDFDAAVIERLDAAGAILLGKLNAWEYGTGGLGAVLVRRSLRAGPESLEGQLFYRRFVHRRGSGGCRRHGDVRARIGYRRIGSRTGCRVRRSGAEADLWPHQSLWHPAE